MRIADGSSMVCLYPRACTLHFILTAGAAAAFPAGLRFLKIFMRRICVCARKTLEKMPAVDYTI